MQGPGSKQGSLTWSQDTPCGLYLAMKEEEVKLITIFTKSKVNHSVWLCFDIGHA